MTTIFFYFMLIMGTYNYFKNDNYGGLYFQDNKNNSDYNDTDDNFNYYNCSFFNNILVIIIIII